MSTNNAISAPSAIPYVPDLDAVRAIAILMVIIGHWIPFGSADFLGFAGVTLFFVLSGYLISSILITYKEKVEKGEKSKAWFFRTFFLRRSLRIFPIYYLYLIVLLCLGVDLLWDGITYYFFYLGNHHIYLIGDFPALKAHLWTLAVEEQFYLFWPFLILFIPSRHLSKAILAFVCIAIASRIFFYLEPMPGIRNLSAYMLTPNCLDSFALGGILAWAQLRSERLYRQFLYNSFPLFLFFSLLFLVLKLKELSWGCIPDRFLFSLVAVCFIGMILRGLPSWAKWLIANSIMKQIGKVSYGLYVYHLIMPYLFYLFVQYLNSRGIYTLAHEPGVVTKEKLYFYTVVLAIVTTLSWRLIETPINNLKKHIR